MKEFVTSSEGETEEVGKQLGSTLQPPATLLLRGNLGAGKTTFTRGVVGGLGVADTSLVRSPTFTLINQYPGPACPIYHVDLYRLDSAREIGSIGLDDILEEPAIVLIEWGEKLTFHPAGALLVDLEVVDSSRRRIRIQEISDSQQRP